MGSVGRGSVGGKECILYTNVSYTLMNHISRGSTSMYYGSLNQSLSGKVLSINVSVKVGANRSQ